MKKLANLKGVKSLSKNEQKSINGGIHYDIPCTCWFSGSCLSLTEDCHELFPDME